MTGTFDESLGGNRQPIDEGSADGNKVAWKVNVQDFTGPITMAFDATIDGDKMAGTIATPLDNAEFTGSRMS
jgi:hypothetical protein